MERDNIDEKYKWNLKDIFDSEEKWEETFKKASEEIKLFKNFAGNLKNPKTLFKCLKLVESVDGKVHLLRLYAYLKADEDVRIGENQILLSKVRSIYSQYAVEFSFVEPELIELGDDLNRLAEEEEVKVYKHYLDKLIIRKDHTLSADVERALSTIGIVTGASSNIYNMLNNADMQFEDVLGKDGVPHKLTHGSFPVYLRSYDRVLRKNASENRIKEYEKLKNTFSQALIENLKKDKAIANVRNYDSVLEMKLSRDHIPVSVYTNLIHIVGENLAPLHKLSKIRKKILGVEKLYEYDMNVPLVKDINIKISYEDASGNVNSSVRILGDDYYNTVKKGFESRWVDVYENIGKASGAYSFSVSGVHPYILMNFNDTISDMFTLAHEMGHAMHSYLTNKNQPIIYAYYSMFIAEIASTVNEALLYEYLMETTTDPKERVYLLNQRIDNFRGTLFRQVIFAEFEKEAHEMVAEGSATLESLSDLFLKLTKKHLGPSVELIPNSKYSWLTIPHFYDSFYIYQYATGFCASIAIVEKIKSEGKPAIEAYLNMLKAGDSDFTISLLKKAGVDLTTKEPIESAMRNFAILVDQLEIEISKIQ